MIQENENNDLKFRDGLDDKKKKKDDQLNESPDQEEPKLEYFTE